MDTLLEHYAETLENRHASGQFIADLLLKLGLLGTIIGFILMLTPIGEIKEFDPSLIQQLLEHNEWRHGRRTLYDLGWAPDQLPIEGSILFLDSVLVSHVNQLTKKLHAHDKDQS